jgi:hypothetical protein
MKHAIDAFLGNDGHGNPVYSLICGSRIRFPANAEVTENEPVSAGAERGWCPTCFPDKVVAQLRDDEGVATTMHPELGEIEQEGDGTTIAEDRGEETVLNEEVVEE